MARSNSSMASRSFVSERVQGGWTRLQGGRTSIRRTSLEQGNRADCVPDLCGAGRTGLPSHSRLADAHDLRSGEQHPVVVRPAAPRTKNMSPGAATPAQYAVGRRVLLTWPGRRPFRRGAGVERRWAETGLDAATARSRSTGLDAGDTAGGLVFSGGTSDRKMHAFDVEEGSTLLWEFPTSSGILAPPTTFMIDGKQYLAVHSGWGGDSSGMQGT